MAGQIALIQRGGCNFGVKVLNAAGRRRVRRDHLQRGQPRAHRCASAAACRRRRQPVHPDDPGRVHVVRHRPEPLRRRSRPATPAARELERPRSSTRTATTTTSSPSPRAATRTTSSSSTRTSTRSTAPACSTTRRARRRSSTRPADEEGEPAQQAAVHLVRRRGARPARLDVLRQQPELDRAGHIGYDLDADVTATPNYLIGVLDPAAADFFAPDRVDDVPGQRVRAVEGRARPRRRLLQLDRQEPRVLLAGRNRRVQFNLAGVPASGVLTGQDCCKTQDEVNLFGGPLGQLRGQPRDASTVAASTTRSGGATTSTTTTRR